MAPQSACRAAGGLGSRILSYGKLFSVFDFYRLVAALYLVCLFVEYVHESCDHNGNQPQMISEPSDYSGLNPCGDEMGGGLKNMG